MREKNAIVVAVLTVCFAIGVSTFFAWKHNVSVVEGPPTLSGSGKSDASAQSEPASTNEPVLPGAAIYDAKHCGTCHSIKGVGNPRYPLDGVGARLNRAELGDAIVGTGSAAAKMSGAVRQRKARYTEMPEDEMSKLIDYLSRLTLAEK